MRTAITQIAVTAFSIAKKRSLRSNTEARATEFVIHVTAIRDAPADVHCSCPDIVNLIGPEVAGRQRQDIVSQAYILAACQCRKKRKIGDDSRSIIEPLSTFHNVQFPSLALVSFPASLWGVCGGPLLTGLLFNIIGLNCVILEASACKNYK